MTFAPRHDWNAYNDAVRGHVARIERAGSTSDEPTRLEAAFLRHANYFDTLQVARRDLLQDSASNVGEDRLSRWSKKIALRQELVTIYRSMGPSRDG